MEKKSEYKTGDQEQISDVARPARRSAAPSDESAKTTRQPAQYHGEMVKMFEVFCQHCDRSDLVGFDQDLVDAEIEALNIGWKTYGHKWSCPEHGESD